MNKSTKLQLCHWWWFFTIISWYAVYRPRTKPTSSKSNRYFIPTLLTYQTPHTTTWPKSYKHHNPLNLLQLYWMMTILFILMMVIVFSPFPKVMMKDNIDLMWESAIVQDLQTLKIVYCYIMNMMACYQIMKVMIISTVLALMMFYSSLMLMWENMYIPKHLETANFRVGMYFDNFKMLKKELRKHCINCKFNYKAVRFYKCRIALKCAKDVCHWYLNTFLCKMGPYIVVRTVFGVVTYLFYCT